CGVAASRRYPGGPHAPASRAGAARRRRGLPGLGRRQGAEGDRRKDRGIAGRLRQRPHRVLLRAAPRTAGNGTEQRMIAYSNVARMSWPSQDELVARSVGLVKRIACHLAARLPASVEMDDLLQAGMIGLLEAAGNFDASRGASFDTYAG